MPTTCNAPSHSAAAGLANPALAATKVAVCWACTVGPSGLPVSQSSPDGISTAKTWAALVLIAAITRSNGATIGPLRPVPNTASTIQPAYACIRCRVASVTAGSANCAIPARRAISAFVAASPRNSSKFERDQIETGHPAFSRWRAIT